MSKATVLTDTSRSVPLSGMIRRIDASRFASARRGTTTPFGVPVDPEV